MRKINLSDFNWTELQHIHDGGVHLNKLPSIIGVSMTVIKRAISAGLLIQRFHKREITHTESARQKLSEKLKIAHKEGRNKGWYHINSRKDRVSYPEQFFISVFKKSGLYDIYHIEEKLFVGKYYLDFAFIDLKLDVEIDGQQHYATEKAIRHDTIRNEYLRSAGWRIYRINWKEVMNDAQEQIKHLLNYIQTIDKQSDHYYELTDVVLTKRRKPVYGNMADYQTARHNMYKNEQSQYIEIIKNSNIDFTKFGWVSKVALILGCKPQKVNKWMQTFMPDFYSQCFHRQRHLQHRFLE